MNNILNFIEKAAKEGEEVRLIVKRRGRKWLVALTHDMMGKETIVVGRASDRHGHLMDISSSAQDAINRVDLLCAREE